MTEETPPNASPRRLLWLGGLAAFAVAIVLFSRFSIDDRMSRDESIYVYAGQQLAGGVPPYVSIVDPKAPLATLISGGAVITGRALGIDDVYAVRITFLILACLSVVAVFLACARVFNVPAGVVGAAVFVTFRGYAMDALGGPNAKTPGVALAALSTALLVNRRWFAGGLVGSMAALVWQPLVIYVVVSVVAAWVGSERASRLRASAAAIAGSLVPAAAVITYFIGVRAWTEFFESAVLLPVTGTVRREAGLLERLAHIADAVHRDFGPSDVLLWAGLLILAWLAVARLPFGTDLVRPRVREPLFTVVLTPLLFLLVFSILDFQGYDDAYPLLPYAALGIAGAAAAGISVLRKWSPRLTRTLPLIGAGLLVAIALTWYVQPRAEDAELVAQRRDAAAANALLGSSGRLYALGNPALLALTGRRNPSPYIYLSAGVDRWVVDHTPGGLAGWQRRIEASDPDMVHLNGWITSLPYRDRMLAWLRGRYVPVGIGELDLFVTQELLDRAGGSG